MIDLPIGRQTFDFDCGAKALQIVMAYYGGDVREDELLKALEYHGNGIPANNMMSVANKMGFEVLAKSGFSLEQIGQFVDENQPVIVLVQAWAERYMTLEDWRQGNEDGHYVIVIGHTGPIIIFEDPASFRRTWMTEEEFIARGHDVDPETKEVFAYLDSERS